MVNNQKSIFVTFGAGRSGWIGAAKRITSEAEKTGLFEFCFNLDERWLKTWDPAIYKIGANLRKNHPPRGFGYWTWKPSVLLWAHLNFPTHQIVYVDAGSQLYSETERRIEFKKLLERGTRFGALAWSLPDHPDNNWTKIDFVHYFRPSVLQLKSDQVQSGFLILSPTEKRPNFCLDFRRVVEVDFGFYFTDQSFGQGLPGFVEHRHDQSVLSFLWKRYAFYTEPDPSTPEKSNRFPILSWRNNSFLKVEQPIILRTFLKYIYICIDKILSKS